MATATATKSTTRKPSTRKTAAPKARTRKAPAPKPEAKPEAPKAEAKPKRSTVRADGELQGKVLAVIEAAGEDGITLKALSDALGIRTRVLHNVTWKLEGSPEVKAEADTPKGEPRKPDEVRVKRLDGRPVRWVKAA